MARRARYLTRRARYPTDNVENFFDRLVKTFETQFGIVAPRTKRIFRLSNDDREERFEIAALKEGLSASGFIERWSIERHALPAI